MIARISLAASLAFALTSAASARTITDVPFEFSFDYDVSELSTDRGEAAVRERLRKEAASYCRTKTRREGVREEAPTCTRAVIAAVESRLERESDAMQLASGH